MTQGTEWQVRLAMDQSLVSLSVRNSRCSDVCIVVCQFSVN